MIQPIRFFTKSIRRMGSNIQLKVNYKLSIDPNMGGLNVVTLNLTYCDEINFTRTIFYEKHKPILKSILISI